jgi:serine/threonine protein kinase
VDTGRVIHKRYLLQHLIEQGKACTVYQSFDQVLQRTVVVKVIPPEHIPAYKAAIHATAQLTHPNIIGLFDVIVEPEVMYVIQEYVKGNRLDALMRSHITPYETINIGIQICQALLYASRKTCHGDLTPNSIIRDASGHVYINNFALPSDTQYFTAWSVVGSGGFVLSDPELPSGQITDGRNGDDTRAVGLLLYQLLAGHAPDATQVAPPVDGRMRFQRHVPPEVCEIIARAVVRVHPQRIQTADDLFAELKHLAEILETVQAPESPIEKVIPTKKSSPASLPSIHRHSTRQTGNLVSVLPSYEKSFEAATLRKSEGITGIQVPPTTSHLSLSAKLAITRQVAYSAQLGPQTQSHKINPQVLFLIGLVLFALFFGIGYMLAYATLP